MSQNSKVFLGKIVCCPCYVAQKILCSPSGECKIIKQLLGFPFGILLGIGLHFLMIDNMKFDETTKYIISGMICMALAFGYALSVQVRCLAILLIPILFTKTGRSVISAIIIGLIISGPVGNIVYNARESIRCISCSVAMGYNLSKQVMELKYRPIANVLSDIMAQAPDIKDLSRDIKKNFSVLTKEVEDKKEIDESINRTNDIDKKMDGWGRAQIIEKKFGKKKKKKEGKNVVAKVHKGSFVENFYAKKQAFRCQDIFNFAADKCDQVFKDMEKKCFKKIGFLGVTSIICLAFRVRKICNLLKMIPSSPNGTNDTCQASDDSVNNGFGEGFVEAEKAAQDFDKNFDVDMKYQLISEEEPLDLKTAEDVAEKIQYEFRIRQMWFEIIVTLIQRLMIFLLFIVIKNGYDYTNSYLNDFRFDNTYVSGYFKKIEERRKRAHKSHLMPFKKVQNSELIYPMSLKFAKSEKKNIVSSSVKIVLDLMTASIIIFFDRLFYEVLNIVREQSQTTVTQKGEHKILFHVHGNSMMAHIFKKLFKGLRSEHKLDSYSSNLECLPAARKLENIFIIRIIMMNVIALIMLFLQAYGMRLRRLICAFFYPKREKKRIIYLYNDLLKKRKSQFEYMKDKVINESKKNRLMEKAGLLVAIRNYFPSCLFWLKYIQSGKKHCLLCKEFESKGFIKCPTTGQCPFSYCPTCWKDLKETCYACMPQEKLKEVNTSTEFPEDEEDND